MGRTLRLRALWWLLPAVFACGDLSWEHHRPEHCGGPSTAPLPPGCGEPETPPDEQDEPPEATPGPDSGLVYPAYAVTDVGGTVPYWVLGWWDGRLYACADVDGAPAGRIQVDPDVLDAAEITAPEPIGAVVADTWLCDVGLTATPDGIVELDSWYAPAVRMARRLAVLWRDGVA